tara:strand:- start:306 stop:1001 length:696 start_codon:yes stop_codon:yes gene_type:complete
MPKHGKKFNAAKATIDRNKFYDPSEAVTLAKEASYASFDEAVDAAVRLNVNPRHADQNVRGSIVLPHGTGKSVRVAVFARGEHANAANEAGADIVGGDDLVKRVQEEGFLDFDVAIATPDMMPAIGRIGRILGPRGLMPNPKTKTVTFDVAPAVSQAKGGKVDFRVDKSGIIHCTIGRRSFEPSQLNDNLGALLTELIRLKPASAKGNYIRSLSVSTTMGPAVRIEPSSLG